MRFLLHGKLDPAVAVALERHGHKTVSLADAVIEADVPADELFQLAHARQLDVLTADRDTAQFARTQAFKFDRSIIYLQLPGGDVELDDAIDRLFNRFKRLKPHAVYTVTEAQVKVQQMRARPLGRAETSENE
jgi:predicted nuclease of predicted toxin-antitoxin system